MENNELEQAVSEYVEALNQLARELIEDYQKGQVSEADYVVEANRLLKALKAAKGY